MVALALFVGACSGKAAPSIRVVDGESLKSWIGTGTGSPRVLLTFASFDPPSVEALPVVTSALAALGKPEVKFCVLGLDALANRRPVDTERDVRSKLTALGIDAELLIWSSADSAALDAALQLSEARRASIKVPAVVLLGKDGGVLDSECDDISADRLAGLLTRING